MTSTRVIFFQVPDSQSKLKRIVETTQFHFRRKEPFLIFVEDEKGEKFVDELLWKLPVASFLPHVASDQTQEMVAITKAKTNANGALFAFNLCPTPLLLPGFKTIYEFEDLSAPNKTHLSSIRFQAYKDAQFSLGSG